MSELNNPVNKIISLVQLETILPKLKKKGKIVLTNGCFDVLHLGHLKYLEQASALGESLIVALNSDSSIKLLKGTDRPINNQSIRIKNISNLAIVDLVIIFEEETPYRIIEKIQPDLLVKGGDYAGKVIVGSDIVKNNGGEVVIVDFLEGYSTTDIIRA